MAFFSNGPSGIMTGVGLGDGVGVAVGALVGVSGSGESVGDVSSWVGACVTAVSSVAGTSVAVGFCAGFADGVVFLLPQAMRIRESPDIRSKSKVFLLNMVMVSSVSADMQSLVLHWKLSWIADEVNVIKKFFL